MFLSSGPMNGPGIPGLPCCLGVRLRGQERASHECSCGLPWGLVSASCDAVWVGVPFKRLVTRAAAWVEVQRQKPGSSQTCHGVSGWEQVEVKACAQSLRSEVTQQRPWSIPTHTPLPHHHITITWHRPTASNTTCVSHSRPFPHSNLVCPPSSTAI